MRNAQVLNELDSLQKKNSLPQSRAEKKREKIKSQQAVRVRRNTLGLDTSLTKKDKDTTLAIEDMIAGGSVAEDSLMIDNQRNSSDDT